MLSFIKVGHMYNNINSVVEFQRWWVLKSKILRLNYFSYLLICMLIQLYFLFFLPVPGSKSRIIPQKHIWNTPTGQLPHGRPKKARHQNFRFFQIWLLILQNFFFLQYPTQGNCGLGSDFILMSVHSTYAALPGRTGYSSKRGQPSGQTAGGNLSLF